MVLSGNVGHKAERQKCRFAHALSVFDGGSVVERVSSERCSIVCLFRAARVPIPVHQYVVVLAKAHEYTVRPTS